MLKLDPVPIKLLLDELHGKVRAHTILKAHPEHTVHAEPVRRPTDTSTMWEVPPEVSSEHTRAGRPAEGRIGCARSRGQCFIECGPE